MLTWLIAATTTFAQPVPEGRKLAREKHLGQERAEAACTPETLGKYRANVFQKQLKEQKFKDAADGLEKYLDKNGCYEALTSHEGSLKAYLWAQLDLAHARRKAKQYVECIRLMRQMKESYYENLLEKANDAKLQTANKTNLELCEKERLDGLTEAKAPACAVDISHLKVDVPTEDSHANLPIKKIASSFQTAPDQCVALVEVEYPAGTIDGVEKPELVPYLVKVERRALSVLPAFNGPGVDLSCGKIDIKYYQGGTFRLTGGLGYCHGGTASWSYDSLWKGTTKLDEATIGLH